MADNSPSLPWEDMSVLGRALSDEALMVRLYDEWISAQTNSHREEELKTQHFEAFKRRVWFVHENNTDPNCVQKLVIDEYADKVWLPFKVQFGPGVVPSPPPVFGRSRSPGPYLLHKDLSVIGQALSDAELMARLFEEWMTYNETSYPTLEEKERRFNAFQVNAKDVYDNNTAADCDQKIGLNVFADRTREELNHCC